MNSTSQTMNKGIRQKTNILMRMQKNTKIDIWDELSPKEQLFIERSRSEIAEGKRIKHEIVIKEMRQILRQ